MKANFFSATARDLCNGLHRFQTDEFRVAFCQSIKHATCRTHIKQVQRSQPVPVRSCRWVKSGMRLTVVFSDTITLVKHAFRYAVIYNATQRHKPLVCYYEMPPLRKGDTLTLRHNWHRGSLRLEAE